MSGSTLVAAWSETASDGESASDYAAEWNGSAWSFTNGGAAVSTAGDADPIADLRTIGATTYLTAESGDFESADVNVLALSGTTFSEVGSSPVTDENMTSLPVLGSATGTPILVEGYADNATQAFLLEAQQLNSGSWTAFGSSLGVPPAAAFGTGYSSAALTTDAAGNAYAIFAENVPAASGQINEIDVYVEEYTAGGVNPNAPFMPTTATPVTTGSDPAPVTSAPAPTTTAPIAPAAVLEPSAKAVLRRKGKKVTLNTGLLASCPTGSTACTAKVTARLTPKGVKKALKVTTTTHLAAGASRTVTVTVPKKTAAKLHGRVHASVSVAVTGPNGKAVTDSEELSATLAAAHETKRTKK